MLCSFGNYRKILLHVLSRNRELASRRASTVSWWLFQIIRTHWNSYLGSYRMWQKSHASCENWWIAIFRIGKGSLSSIAQKMQEKMGLGSYSGNFALNFWDALYSYMYEWTGFCMRDGNRSLIITGSEQSPSLYLSEGSRRGKGTLTDDEERDREMPWRVCTPDMLGPVSFAPSFFRFFVRRYVCPGETRATTRDAVWRGSDARLRSSRCCFVCHTLLYPIAKRFSTDAYIYAYGKKKMEQVLAQTTKLFLSHQYETPSYQ